jgi:hypothetical protein
MTPLPTPISPTVAAIYRAYEADNESWDSWGLSVGELGNECDRSLFYTLRWASPLEAPDGRKISIFRTGDRWEDILVGDLEKIGVEVWGQQDRIRMVSGHVRGKRDGALLGLAEAPKTEHLLEIKSMNDSNFKQVVKHGVQNAQPKHHVQLQLGMHMFGLTRGAYVVVNKNTDERHLERVNYDLEFCLRILAKAQRIIESDETPARSGKDHKAMVCMFCRHKPLCHQVDADGEQAPEPVFARVSCRSCLYAQPTMDGDAQWNCQRFSRPLSIDDQRAGCAAHLFVPGLVPGEQVDASEEDEWVAYSVRGERWVDGVEA